MEINHAREIDEIFFDAMSDKKGAFVIRMLQSYLGAECFQVGCLIFFWYMLRVPTKNISCYSGNVFPSPQIYMKFMSQKPFKNYVFKKDRAMVTSSCKFYRGHSGFGKKL